MASSQSIVCDQNMSFHRTFISSAIVSRLGWYQSPQFGKLLCVSQNKFFAKFLRINRKTKSPENIKKHIFEEFRRNRRRERRASKGFNTKTLWERWWRIVIRLKWTLHETEKRFSEQRMALQVIEFGSYRTEPSFSYRMRCSHLTN